MSEANEIENCGLFPAVVKNINNCYFYVSQRFPMFIQRMGTNLQRLLSFASLMKRGVGGGCFDFSTII
ncbi:hypothetical protein C7391_1218 [Methanimicrococcus blatticola]|uniref:Uncharacterized protein n=1 Tax=Methanimicrococcus blatticola TaxID=91560 RepID=A0A484F469_9EURY|nr:hypothetical protein C7391_1218 [Methanimicrococcus blatticola]